MAPQRLLASPRSERIAQRTGSERSQAHPDQIRKEIDRCDRHGAHSLRNQRLDRGEERATARVSADWWQSPAARPREQEDVEGSHRRGHVSSSRRISRLRAPTREGDATRVALFAMKSSMRSSHTMDLQQCDQRTTAGACVRFQGSPRGTRSRGDDARCPHRQEGSAAPRPLQRSGCGNPDRVVTGTPRKSTTMRSASSRDCAHRTRSRSS